MSLSWSVPAAVAPEEHATSRNHRMLARRSQFVRRHALEILRVAGSENSSEPHVLRSNHPVMTVASEFES